MILNLTQHNSTPEQQEAGVVDVYPCWKNWTINHLTFNQLPTKQEIQARVASLVEIAHHHTHTHSNRTVMIGGAPFLMGPLEAALRANGITPVYAFSVRQSEEVLREDGTVKKVNIFKHAGFVEGAL